MQKLIASAVILTLALAQQCSGKSTADNGHASSTSVLKHETRSTAVRSSLEHTVGLSGTQHSPASATGAATAALVNRAEYCNRILESEEAVSLCSRSIAQDSSFAPAYIARAEAYAALGKTAEAISDLTTASKNRNFRVNALCDRARLYIGLKRYTEAVADLNAIIIGTGSDGQYCLRAQAYAAIHKPDLAAKDLTEVLKQKPHDYRILLERSKAYLESRQLDKALADCNELIKMDEANNEGMANAQLYKDRATVYCLLGKKKLADLDFARAQEKQKTTFENAPFRLHDGHH